MQMQAPLVDAHPSPLGDAHPSCSTVGRAARLRGARLGTSAESERGAESICTAQHSPAASAGMLPCSSENCRRHKWLLSSPHKACIKSLLQARIARWSPILSRKEMQTAPHCRRRAAALPPEHQAGISELNTF